MRIQIPGVLQKSPIIADSKVPMSTPTLLERQRGEIFKILSTQQKGENKGNLGCCACN
jgi:hypothetical protein